MGFHGNAIAVHAMEGHGRATAFRGITMGFHGPDCRGMPQKKTTLPWGFMAVP